MRKIFSIAHNTYREAIRDRILYGFLFFAIALILFSLILGQLSFNEQLRCTIDVGLSGISLFSILISIFLGITLLHKEIEKRTIYPILSKPVSRGAYIVGKFCGLSFTLLLLILLMGVVFYIVLRIQGGSLTSGLLIALLLLFIETMLMISIALFFTSFSSPFLSGLFCLGIFFSGRNADLISELGTKKSFEALAPILNGISAVLPNLYLFYPSGKMIESNWVTIHDQYVSSGYVLTTVAYGIVYTAAFLLFSTILFSRRDFV